MRILSNILLLTALLFTSCCKSQTGFLGQVKPSPVIYLFSGESNSGGMALNSDANPTEVDPRPLVQILHNRTFQFQALDIGTNNNIDHYNLDSTIYHGWELELANRMYTGLNAGVPNRDTVYLVKTGQGGSIISEWGVNSTYWTKFQQRLDAAINLLVAKYGAKPQIILFYTQGINDKIAGTDTSTWKAATIAHLNKIRAKYGTIPIYVPYFMTGFTDYNAAWDSIAAQLPNVTMVSTTGAALQNSYHWSYAGMKVVADNLINASLNYP